MSDPTQAVILIIDDDRTSRHLLQQLLGRDNYQVHVAEDGESGLATAFQVQPDIIILDVVMPGLDGFQVCAQLRLDPGLAEVPILMLTGLEDSASRLAGLQAGADDFISKPFSAPELRARLRTMVRLNRSRRLRTQRDRFRWVVESVEHGYLLMNQAGRLLYANPMAKSMFGIDDELLPETDLLPCLERQFRLHPPDHWRDWPDLPQPGPLYMVRPETNDAPTAWLEVRVLAQSLGGEKEILLQFRDVTAEVSSQRNMWSFEALVGHKLLTPLTKITWGLSLIASKVERLTADQIREFALMSSAGVDELKFALEEVLKHLNTPHARPGDQGYPLAGLEATLRAIEAQLELVPVLSQMPPELVATSLGISPRAFEIILWELLNNSKKFHPHNRPQVELTVHRMGTEVVLKVTDDGNSLSPGQLTRAFIPYYQSERYFTGQVPGMGLGLSMVRSMLWEIGGECSLRNRNQQDGIVVEIRVPVNTPA